MLLDLCDDLLATVVGACCLLDLNALARSCERLRQASVHRRALIQRLATPPFGLSYSQIFHSAWINLGVCALEDHHLRVLSAAIASGALPSVTHLGLYQNSISDVGIAALARAVTPMSEGGGGAMASAVILDLGRNRIGDEGMRALSSALRSGALPHLAQLFIDSPSAELAACCSTKRIQLYS